MQEKQKDAEDGTVWPPPPLYPAVPPATRSFFERVSLWLLAGIATGFGLCGSGVYCLSRYWERKPVLWQGALTQGLIVAGGIFSYYLWMRWFVKKGRRLRGAESASTEENQ